MHRPSSILTRWSRELIPGDIVSGAIIVGIIIISFLSLMSFADFLRVHWQQPEHENDDAQGRRNGHGNDFEDGHVVDNNDEEEGIDDAIVDFIEDHSIVLASASRPYELAGESSEEALQDTSQADGATSQHAQTIETARQQLESTIRGTLQQAAAGNVDQDDAQDSDEEAIPHDDGDSESDGEYDPDDDSGEEDDDEFDNEFEDEDAMDDDDEDPPPEAFGNGNGVFDPLDPVLQDDQVVRIGIVCRDDISSNKTSLQFVFVRTWKSM
jgi:E3 ubiquitin-protein ligase MARCH6